MSKRFLSFLALVLAFVPFSLHAQTKPADDPAPAKTELARDPWEIGAFFQGGLGEGDRDNFTFTSAGVRVGKVITDPHLGSIFRGQFEYAGELMPYWQSFTPDPHYAQTKIYSQSGQYLGTENLPYGGGTYTGVSITPIILRWNFVPARRFAPYIQGAGGLIYTTHKYPPDILVDHGQPGGTSVFNFTPQFGLGFHYFVKPHRSVDFSANAIHISSASLGDRNPGVNASVQFQVGYTWWK
ncbi:acyloxyacyl hydrolase [Silvibacterium acidisoli]|uniref:acyloxyacyl hydrolase n=1 Tax=Acidobacteriaceae bacterium ZG23-2 TaxID=2883246 RepID=UPI00406C05C7